MKITTMIRKILASKRVACEFKPGVFLSSADDMIADQLAWDDEDPCKDMDFSTSAFWITTDDGVEPEGIDSDEELLEIFPGYEENV